jgi:HK97 family phage major capsid protein
MPTNIDQNTAEKIVADIAKFGTDVAALQDSTKRDLNELRSAIDENGKKSDPVAIGKIDALATLVETKVATLEGNLKAANDNIEALKAVNKRPGAVGGGWGDDDEAKTAKEAFAWHKAKLIAEGKLPAGDTVEADAAAYAAYTEAFPHYMRARGDNALKPQFMGAMQTGSDPDGGYLVPTQYSTRTMKRVYETSNLRGLATIETIGGKELILPRDEGEFGYGGWVGEITAPSETTTSQLGETKIFAHEMYAEPRVTQNMIEDAGIDIEAWVSNKVGEKMGRIEATAFHTGDGSNKPKGFLMYAAWATSGDDGHLENGKIEQIVSGGATTLTADAFYNVYYGLKDKYAANANWLMKRITVRDVMKLKDGQGNYLWQMGDIKSGQPTTILTAPVTRSEDMPTIAASSLSVAFGDFKEAYTIVDRLGLTLLRDNLTAKPYVKFYNRRRVGGAVVNFEAIKLMKTST